MKYSNSEIVWFKAAHVLRGPSDGALPPVNKIGSIVAAKTHQSLPESIPMTRTKSHREPLATLVATFHLTGEVAS